MSCVRMNSSTRPANTKQSPGRSRAMKLSSMVPILPPLRYFTCIDASPTMVPTCSRWRLAMPRSGTRYRPSTSGDAVVLGVGGQARAALLDEVQRPLELGARELAVGMRAAHLGVQRLRLEAAAQRHGDEVLHQHVQRLVRRGALLDAPGLRGTARGGRLDQLQRVGRHERDAARPPRRMAAAAGALQQPRDALRRADLQHALHRQEVHAQVQRRGGDHRLQPPFLQAQLDPLAHLLVERAVVQRDEARPFGPLAGSAAGTRSRPANGCW